MSNEHPDMSGNWADAPFYCDQCGKDFAEDKAYGIPAPHALSTNDEFDDDCDPDAECWQCGGECYVVIGEDVSARDIDLGNEGKLRVCPCCNGSGLAKDETYW